MGGIARDWKWGTETARSCCASGSGAVNSLLRSCATNSCLEVLSCPMAGKKLGAVENNMKMALQAKKGNNIRCQMMEAFLCPV